jgi:DNA-binding transcriptional ArsR family regulator
VSDCRDESQTAGDLAAASELAMASVSEHLKVLRTCGLIVLERDGRFRRYRADRKLVRALSALLRNL